MKSIRTTTLSLLTFLALATGARAFEPGVTTRAHYLIFTVDDRDEVTLVSDQEVTLHGAMTSDESDETKNPHKHGKKSVVARVADRSGKQLFKKVIDIEQFLRVERPDLNGHLHTVELQQDVQTFVVRVPVSADDDSIEIELKKNGKKKSFPLKKAKANKLTTQASDGLVQTANDSYWGDPANRVDLLIMGDGYTAAQQTKFNTDRNAVEAGFFQISPYHEYENFVNVVSLFTASAQSGADHPVCNDPQKNYDPLEGTFVNTAFDATYCNWNVQRALVANYTKILNAATAYPDWDFIMVIVNDTMHGGTGGGLSVFAVDGTLVETAQHEHGHSFSGLGDEYDTYGGGSGCDDLAGTPWTACAPNITNATTRSAIKWNPWIAASTPIPTPETATYDNVVGLFQGAQYDPTGHYRPKNGCLMQGYGWPFCEICKQNYILRLYDWVDPIEYHYPSLADVYSGPNTTSFFSTTVLGPLYGPSPTREWRVNGVLTGPSGATSLNYTPTANGNYTIQFKTKDPTTLVHPAMAGTALESAYTWTLHVSQPAPPANFTAIGYGWYIGIEWTPVPNATGYRIEKSTDNVNWTYVTTVNGQYGYHSIAGTAGQAYLIRIATIDEHSVQGTWATDLATVFVATDEALPSGTVAKATHINEVRAATNAARTQLTSLGNATYTSAPATNGVIRAVHVTDTRDAIAQLRSALGLPPYSFTDFSLSGVTIKRVHVLDLRDAIR